MRSRRDEQGAAVWRPPIGRWRPADGQAMLAALAASGRSATAFARVAGIGLHRVNYWRMKLDVVAPPSPPADRREPGAGFVAVDVRGDDAHRVAVTHDRRVEVTLANGRRVAF